MPTLPNLKDERGFTMLELCIVMVVLGILSAVAVPSYLSFKDKGRKAGAVSDVRNVVMALNAYANDNFAGAATGSDPDWNGTDAPGAGTNADNGWHNAHSVPLLNLLRAKYNPALPSFTVNPTGYTPSPDDTVDYCVYTTNGVWYAARRAASQATTVGKTLVLNTCTAS